MPIPRNHRKEKIPTWQFRWKGEHWDSCDEQDNSDEEETDPPCSYPYATARCYADPTANIKRLSRHVAKRETFYTISLFGHDDREVDVDPQ